MNAYEHLLTIRDALEQNGANEDTIDMIDKFLKRAEPERNSATNVTRSMIMRHLLRQKETLGNDFIYNDLQEILDNGRETKSDEEAAPYAWEDTTHRPKPKSYYKALKAKQQQ